MCVANISESGNRDPNLGKSFSFSLTLGYWLCWTQTQARLYHEMLSNDRPPPPSSRVISLVTWEETMEPKLKDNGAAQLLMPLLGRVPAFRRVVRELQLPGGLQGTGGPRSQNCCSDLLGSGSGLAKILTHVKGLWSPLSQGAAFEKRNLVGNL